MFVSIAFVLAMPEGTMRETLQLLVTLHCIHPDLCVWVCVCVCVCVGGWGVVLFGPIGI